VAVSLALTPGLVAQVVGVVDVGVADVRYDGFLPSSAASISPTFGLELPWALVSVRGTYLHFESGRHSLQGNLAASLFTRPTGRLRGEFSGSLGASRYAAFASFARPVRPEGAPGGERQGAWLSGMAGSSAFGQVPRPATVSRLARGPNASPPPGGQHHRHTRRRHGLRDIEGATLGSVVG
jgi:hypothetical protein